MATAKKTAPAAKAVKFAKGKEVRVTRGGQVGLVGRYVGSVKKANGEWHHVNMAAKGVRTPDVRVFRASQIERV